MNELRALQEHQKETLAMERENSAFSGYSAGVAFAMAWGGKLPSFSEFYQPAQACDLPPEDLPSLEDHIQMMLDRGEGGPPIDRGDK